MSTTISEPSAADLAAGAIQHRYEFRAPVRRYAGQSQRRPGRGQCPAYRPGDRARTGLRRVPQAEDPQLHYLGQVARRRAVPNRATTSM